MSFSDYLEDKILKHVFTNTPYTGPSTLYVGLFTSDADDVSPGTEVTGGSYTREVASFAVSGTNPTEATTTSAIEFSPATAPWGTITYAGVFDASTGGNMLAYAQLTDPSDFVTPLPKTIDTGDIFRISAGNLKVRLD